MTDPTWSFMDSEGELLVVTEWEGLNEPPLYTWFSTTKWYPDHAVEKALEEASHDVRTVKRLLLFEMPKGRCFRPQEKTVPVEYDNTGRVIE